MTSSKRQSGKPAKQRKNGVDSTAGEHRCPFGKCDYSADNRRSLEAHIRAKHLRSPTPPKDGTGEGVTSPEPLDIQHLRDELERDKLELDRLRLKKKIDELDDDGQDDPWDEVDKMEAREAMMELRRNRHNPQQPVQTDGGRVSELERTVDELTHRYQLAQLQTDVESRVAEVEAHTQSRMGRLEARLQRPPADRRRTADELQSEQNLKMMSEGFGLLSQSMGNLSKRVDGMSGKFEKLVNQAMPLAKSIAAKKLQMGSEEREEWKDRERTLADISEQDLVKLDQALREVYGENYDRDSISEEEAEETLRSIQKPNPSANPGRGNVILFRRNRKPEPKGGE